MDNYLYHKYKGKYRVLPHYDIETNEHVTEEDGSDCYSAQYVFAIKKRK